MAKTTFKYENAKARMPRAAINILASRGKWRKNSRRNSRDHPMIMQSRLLALRLALPAVSRCEKDNRRCSRGKVAACHPGKLAHSARRIASSRRRVGLIATGTWRDKVV